MSTPDKKHLSECCGVEKVKKGAWYENPPKYICRDCGKPFVAQSSDPFTEKTFAEFDEKFGDTFVLQEDARDFLLSALNAQREERTLELNKAYLEDMKKWRERHYYDFREEIQEKIEIMLATSSPYMFPATEKRFINDLRILLSPNNKENE